MMTTYLPDQMLRNLAAQPVTEAQQQEMDARLGSAVAAVFRRTSRTSRRAQSRRAGGTGLSLVAFRKAAADCPSRPAGAACR